MSAPSAFMALALAMQQALQAPPAVSAHVCIARARALPSSMSSAIVVRPVQAERDGAIGAGASALWSTSMALECYARGQLSDAVGAALDALVQAAGARLLQDAALAQLAPSMDIKGITWDFDVDGEQTACATLVIHLQHATAAASFV